MSRPPFLSKAEDAATAAQALFEKNLLDCAASRAYYSVFHAARAALIAAGVSTPARGWSHEAIQGGFAQLTHRRKLYSSELLSDLPQLLNLRLLADYAAESVSSRQADNAVKRAKRFVAAVVKVITSD